MKSVFVLADEPIHFALLFPTTGAWQLTTYTNHSAGTLVAGGFLVAGAAALAVEQVNVNKSLLPGRVLRFSWADSGCSAKQGLAAMGQLLQGKSRIDAVIGPGCRFSLE